MVHIEPVDSNKRGNSNNEPYGTRHQAAAVRERLQALSLLLIALTAN
jgi:hypothetical protein